MGWNVYVTRQVPQPGLDVLRGACEKVDLWEEDTAPPREALLEAAAGRDGLLCLLSDRVDAELLDAVGPQLRAVANYAVGYDNVDVKECTRRGVAVSNTPGVLTDTTAELAWALMFAAARRIPESDRFVRTGRWKGWGPMQMLGVDFTGKTLGIVGAGRIGSAVARKCAGFEMRVLYCDRADNPELEAELGARRVELDELLRESDIVSVHVPLTDATRHLIGAPQLRLMRDTAVLVNTSRGPVLDEAALVEALRSDEIFAAGLDVYENEPELTPGLAELDNVVLAPHIGSGTRETRGRMAEMAAGSLVEMLEGRCPDNCVNPEAMG